MGPRFPFSPTLYFTLRTCAPSHACNSRSNSRRLHPSTPAHAHKTTALPAHEQTPSRLRWAHNRRRRRTCPSTTTSQFPSGPAPSHPTVRRRRPEGSRLRRKQRRSFHRRRARDRRIRLGRADRGRGKDRVRVARTGLRVREGALCPSLPLRFSLLSTPFWRIFARVHTLFCLPTGPQPYPPTPGGSSAVGEPSSMAVTTLPPPPSSSAMPPVPVDLSVDPATVPPELKNEGQDWFAVFNAAPPVPGDGARSCEGALPY